MTDTEQVGLLREAFDQLFADPMDEKTVFRRAISIGAALECPSLHKFRMSDLSTMLGINRKTLWESRNKNLVKIEVLKAKQLIMGDQG